MVTKINQEQIMTEQFYYTGNIKIESIGANFAYCPDLNPINALFGIISELQSRANIFLCDIDTTRSSQDNLGSPTIVTATISFFEKDKEIVEPYIEPFSMVKVECSLQSMIIANPKLYSTIDNPTSEIRQLAIRHLPENILITKNPTLEEWMIAVSRKPSIIGHYKNPPLSLQKKAVDQKVKDGLDNIEVHSPELQDYVVGRYVYYNAIEYIKNPTDAAIKFAVDAKPENIKYIKNPTVEQMRIAVAKDAESIQYIDNPPEEIQLLSIKKSFSAFRHLKSPARRVIWKVLKGSPGMVSNIPDPDRKIQEYMVRKTTHFCYMQKMDEDLQMEVIKTRPEYFRNIQRYNPSMDIIKTAITLRPSNIQYVKKPLLELQVAAIKSDPESVRYISDSDLRKTAIVEAMVGVEDKYLAKTLYNNANNKSVKTYLSIRFNGFV